MEIEKRWRRFGATLALLALLTGCGGGSEPPPPPPPPPPTPITKAQAARLLEQASFGPSMRSIDEVVSAGPSGWIDDQFAKAQTSHVAYIESQLPTLTAGQNPPQTWIFETFWARAASAPDQLRQRVAYALSQVFVISLVDGSVNNNIRGVAGYMDLLGEHAFGNYRTLIEAVSRSPMMGLYLSHLRNQKEDPARGRVPDENYAREVMQLFSIGLYELNADGSTKLVGGEPVETYTNVDVTGLAKVFTGFSWAGPDKSNDRFFGRVADPNRDLLPMQGYPQYHSTSAKTFLGTTIAAQTTADPDASLRVALDTLFNHPNVGPFIGRQLIQRLVRSDPSPAYVARVSAAFADNGQGIRGDMRAVLRAVLLDAEARQLALASDLGAGKLREPVLRLAHWMRAFNAGSATGRFLMDNTDNPATRLAQTPLRSPSVFNFYRPGYVPPNTALASSGIPAPEFQITNETSVVGYLNYMQSVVGSGAGRSPASGQPRDIQPDYSAEIALAADADALIDRIDLLLTHGAMSAATRTRIRDAVSAVSATTSTGPGNRAKLAVFLTLASPEYLAQR